MTQLNNVSVIKKSNIYFDGECISHTILTADGTRKTVGVIFPSRLTFNTEAPERMEVVAGQCRVRLGSETEWRVYGAGAEFAVAANSQFDIEVSETLDYVCHFG